MASVDDDAGVLYAQPEMVVPTIAVDPISKIQESPQTLPEPVDSALIELIQSVQHELRTPLHGMLAHINALTTDMRTAIRESGNAQRVSDINALGTQLFSILDDFGDFASHTIEARSAEKRHEKVLEEEADLSEILDDLAGEVWDHQVRRMKAEQGPDCRIPPPPELILTLDSSLKSQKSLVCVESFRKVARKLIDNAMRFTQGEGFVEVSLAPHRMRDAANEDVNRPTTDCLRLTVEDTGSGMTTEFVSESLFTPFAKADNFKSGAGLSMALCSSLVRRMGGSMQVSSDQDRGTTVVVLIPVKSLPEKSREERMALDSPDELVYFFRFDSLGLRRLAGSIASQLAMFGNLYTTTHVGEADYILLPEEVCYGKDNDSLEQLLEQAKDGVKIGVLQSHKDAKIELTAKKAGSPAPIYCTRKPFGPRSFARLIQMANKEASPEIDSQGRLSMEDALGSFDHSASDSHPTANGKQANHSVDLIFTTDMSDHVLRKTPPAARMITPLWDSNAPTSSLVHSFSALCVEDNALNMRILTKVLSQCKIPFAMAADGIEAVEILEKQKHQLILLDINMPRMNGYEVAKWIRKVEAEQRDRNGRAHIIAITALSDDYSKKKGMEGCGMDEWLSKPLNFTLFKQQLIQLHQAFQKDHPSPPS